LISIKEAAMRLSLYKLFEPDRIYQSIDRIDFAQLFAKGKRLVLLDIDNTLVRHGSHAADAFAHSIVARIQAAGLTPYIVSNAKPSRARRFAESLSVPFTGLAGKPSPHGLLKGCTETGFPAEQAVMIGDQLFTDILAARRAKIMAILVLPLDRREVWNVAIKRIPEAPFMARFRRQDHLWPRQ
jgi:HAD superfamily phosphatase (TIGR01668 family)